MRRRHRPRRSWRVGVAVDRRPLRPSPLGLTLALRPSRTTVRATSTVTRVTRVVHHVAPTLLRSAGPVYVSTTAPREDARPLAAAPAERRAPERVPPVERVHTRLRVEQLRVERHLRTETFSTVPTSAPRGPRGAPRLPGPALTLVHAAPAAAPAVTPAVSESLTAPVEVLPAARPAPRADPVAFSVPDVDALASQVLDRIERRAIAQRERMGRI